jgi:uncharacterized repeat protein (TIGR03803 family)
VQGRDGNFYGTTGEGGTSYAGTVFRISRSGTYTNLYSFGSTPNDGGGPDAGLVQGSDGNFYGPTSLGGNLSLNTGAGCGTVFKLTPAGVLTSLVQFNGTTGGYSVAGLVQGTNGNFYGTAEYGGNLSANDGYGFGTVFKLTPAGVLTTLSMLNLTNGYNPAAGLAQGSDGNFYGTTDGGGSGGNGTVFRMTPAGVLTTLVSFNGTNGINPQGGLVQGNDGNFYGTTEYGGANGLGTVFQVTTNGTLTTLVAFGGQTNDPGPSFSRLH